MKFILPLAINQIDPPGEFQSGAAVHDIAVAMERAGIAAACVSEHPAPSAEWLRSDPAAHDALDPFTALAFAAAATTRLKVFTNAVILPFRNPFITAKAAATLQILSDGRLIMGVGLGYQQAEFAAVGAAYNRRGRLADEALATIRLAWRGGEVTTRGSDFDAVGVEPRPVPQPAPPIWIGGGSDKAIERAARWGDGWMPYFSMPTKDPTIKASSVVSIEHFAEKRDRLMALRASQGATSQFEIAVNPPYRPRPFVDGDAARFVELAGRLAEQGVNWMWTPVAPKSRTEFLEHIAWFGETVVSQTGGA